MHTQPREAVPSPTEPTLTPTQPTDLLNLKATCLFFGGIHSATLYRGIPARRYPAPIKVGPNTSRWLRSECEAALQAMIARRAAQ